jgi:predicted PurR-regulated permease PerM
MSEARAAVPLRALAGLVLVIACLYWARAIFVPLALAVLLTFLLSPLVHVVRRIGLGRGPAVLAVVLFALLVSVAVGWGLFRQVNRLADELPQYRSNISRKIADLRQARRETLSKVERSAKELLDEIQTVAPAKEAPAPVVVDRTADPAARFRVGVIEGLGSAVFVILLLIFMLIRQQDLRERIIRLFGERRRRQTTRALDDAAARVTRYLLAHSAINAAFGVAVGLGLFLIGVPYALVWGGLGAILRFVPYAGVWIAMGLPVLMSLAAFDGWLSPLLVMGLFAAVEIAMVFAVEPLVYGKSAGVSDVALIVAVAFWIWLWGPLGLVLATPLTVCVVVFARHVPDLDFLTILMTEEPATEPDVAYYQRLLARDRAEAAELLEARLTSGTVTQLTDEILVPTLVRARRELDAGRLDDEEHAYVVAATMQLVDDIVVPAEGAAPRAGTGARILACAARDGADELVLRLLQEALPEAVIVPPGRTVSELFTAAARPALVCISALPPGGGAQVRHLGRRIRAAAPDVTLVVGRWGEDPPEDRAELLAAGAHHVVSSLAQALRLVETLSASAAPAEPEASLVGTPR